MGLVKGTAPPVQTFAGYTKQKPPSTFVLDIAGGEAKGKTHLALTSPNPAICDTERKAFRVLDKGIGNPERHFSPSTWYEAHDFFDFVAKDPTVESVVIDTLAEIEEFAYMATLSELGKESLYSREAGAVQFKYVNEKLEGILRLFRVAGKNVITTARMKDEYLKNDKTGRQIRDGWKKMPYYADFAIEAVETVPGVLTQDLKPGTLVWKVTKNGSVIRGLFRPYVVVADYKDLISQLLSVENDVPAYLERLKASITKEG